MAVHDDGDRATTMGAALEGNTANVREVKAMKSTGVWIVVTVALFFVAGVLAGVFIERKLIDDRLPPPPPVDDRADKRMKLEVQRLSRELSLTPEQTEAVEKILDDHKEEFDTIRTEIHGRIKGMIDRVNAQIETVLDEKQTAKFREIQERHRHRFKDCGEPRGDRHKMRFDKRRQTPGGGMHGTPGAGRKQVPGPRNGEATGTTDMFE